MGRAVAMAKRGLHALLVIFCMLVPMLTGSLENIQDDDPEEVKPTDIWSASYANHYHPWGGDDASQFKAYHDYDSMRDRMLQLAEQSSYTRQCNDGEPSNDPFSENCVYRIMTFHEGLNGGVNKRLMHGEPITRTSNDYKGTFYNEPSPWMKITGGGEARMGADGGDCNDFVGDCGNYADIPDIQLVGNHHAREWMSYEVPMFFLETVAYYYGMDGIDNDGDGEFDEDGWGDTDGDGQLDDDGDCLSLSTQYQDSNGDGLSCGPGDLGVDEDFSEADITTLIDTREIYLIPMLNVDGNRYDREVFCGENAWENCPSGGWRKNLRDNFQLIPDQTQEVDEDCDGVDLNRNYQFEWGWPLGATVPLIAGTCTPSEQELEGTSNDVYTGPFDCPTCDNDGDGIANEDNVDGEDDDGDNLEDEDPAGGNSEPETRFIQDLTEMNDDNGDGASDYLATLTWHSYSELVLYPWGHCVDCQTTDHEELIYHGNKMATMTGYSNMQSSDLYPTSGDYCDWQYGVHDSYCYTIEIGTAFHQHPDDIDHIAVRNVGIPFYMVEIADAPRERAQIGIEEADKSQWLIDADNLTIPESGPIPVTMCVDPYFPLTNNETFSHVMWRTVKPTRQQTDFGPKEWVEEDWMMTGFQETGENCTLNNNNTGNMIVSMVPIDDEFSGKLQYKAMLGTRSGAFPFSYPMSGSYEEVDVPYRAPYGNAILAFLLFALVAGTVWGSLGIAIKKMNESEDEEPSIVGATD